MQAVSRSRLNYGSKLKELFQHCRVETIEDCRISANIMYWVDGRPQFHEFENCQNYKYRPMMAQTQKQLAEFMISMIVKA